MKNNNKICFIFHVLGPHSWSCFSQTPVQLLRQACNIANRSASRKLGFLGFGNVVKHGLACVIYLEKLHRAYFHPCCNLRQKRRPCSDPRNMLPHLARRLALRPITLFVLQCNIAVRQFSRKCCPYKRVKTFIFSCTAKFARARKFARTIRTYKHARARKLTFSLHSHRIKSLLCSIAECRM